MSDPDVSFIRVAYPDPGEVHRVAVYQWGGAPEHTVVCVHGLTRNARDFDFLAAALSPRFRVVAVDMPGRGQSEWLARKESYQLASYITDIQAVLAHIGVQAVDWVGTSMGGMLGMLLAAQSPGTIRRLVLNDVGAHIPGPALARLGGYVGKYVRFATRAEAETCMRAIYAPFGIREEAQWQHLFRHSLQELPDGSVRMAYDPAIGDALSRDPEPQDIELWELWKNIHCPVLLLRGEHSDILARETAQQMQALHPATTLHEVPGVGHAPTLMDEAEIAVIAKWLGSRK